MNIKRWTLLVQGSFKRDLWKSMFFVIVWTDWYERNELKFNNKELQLTI